MENNQDNIVSTATKSQEVIAKTNKHESVNSSAESILNAVSLIGLIIGIIASVIVFIYGILEVGTGPRGREFGLTLLGSSLLVVFVSIIQWAVAKTFINISRNLFNLNYTLEEIKSKLNS